MQNKTKIYGKISLSLLVISAMLLSSIGFLVSRGKFIALAGGTYSITGSYTVSGFTVNLSGTASGNPYVGQLNQQKVSVDCGINGDNIPNNWVSANQFNITSSGGSGNNKWFNATWSHSCNYTTAGSYNIFVRVHHQNVNGAEGSDVATYRATITVPGCTPGTNQPCLTNLPGICAAGTQTCQSDGTWGSCVQNNQPTDEDCDNQLDDDCDGYTDSEDSNCWECTPNATSTCSTGLPGICAIGTKTCQPNGTWGQCIQDNDPTTEICDGQNDENCDGSVDEGCSCVNGETRLCGPQTEEGECAFGTQTCENGQWGTCVGAVYPSEEICDGLDNDCDGTIDNDNVCSTNYYCDNDSDGYISSSISGSCNEYDCVPGDCSTEPGVDCDDDNKNINPGATEICNGIDDNCNGLTDEGDVCVTPTPTPSPTPSPSPAPLGFSGGGGAFYWLNVTVDGTGNVESADGKINCPNVCSAYYSPNSTVTLTAKPTSVTQFVGWSGDCAGNNLTCTLSMNSAKNVSAKFTGQVAGITTCGIYMTKYIKYGAQNDPEEVKKLQEFLNIEMGANLPVTGIYDAQTMEWVNAFQLKYKDEVLKPWVEAGLHDSENVPTGYVYKTTLRWINMIMCPELNLSMPDLSEDRTRLLGILERITGQEEEILPPGTTLPPETLGPETSPEIQIPSGEVGEKPAEKITPEAMKASLWEAISGSGWFWLVVVLVIAGGTYYVLKKTKKKPTI